MSSIFQRLKRLAHSVISDFDKETDNDYQDAWDELNEFLDEERSWKSSPENRKGADPLTRDYANLEAAAHFSTEKLKQNYKRLLKQYHPDKFAGNPEKQAIATEITVKLNESYTRIMRQRQST